MDRDARQDGGELRLLDQLDSGCQRVDLEGGGDIDIFMLGKAVDDGSQAVVPVRQYQRQAL